MGSADSHVDDAVDDVSELPTRKKPVYSNKKKGPKPSEPSAAEAEAAEAAAAAEEQQRAAEEAAATAAAKRVHFSVQFVEGSICICCTHFCRRHSALAGQCSAVSALLILLQQYLCSLRVFCPLQHAHVRICLASLQALPRKMSPPIRPDG